ncbi:MAG: cobalamin biosynthesis protein CobD [Rhodospirillaceae bacterium]|nr:cobalamin biosynthesis protein CobD [Rhodospirillaceae bacterium]
MRGMMNTLSPAGILLLALLFDAVVGDPYVLYRTIPHPVALIGKAIAVLERLWNHPERSPQLRHALGVLLLAVLAGGMAIIGLAMHGLALTLPYGWIIEALAVYVLIAQKSLYVHVRAVARSLKSGDLAKGRTAVSMIVGRDPNHLDEAGVCRAAIESCAESYSDGIVSPIFWYVLLGLPGLFAFKAVNTLDSMVGHLTERYKDFGWASARFDDVMNWIPARLSGLFLVLAAAPWPWASARRAWRVMCRDAKVHHSPNAGWPESAMAGALGLTLLGPRIYPGEVIDAPWIGEGTPHATSDHITRSLKLYATACVLSGCAAIAALTLIGL